jgi:hypothetical protein
MLGFGRDSALSMNWRDTGSVRRPDQAGTEGLYGYTVAKNVSHKMLSPR